MTGGIEFPADVLKVIFTFLDVVSLLKSRRVCVLWREQSGMRLSEECVLFMNRYFEECRVGDDLRWGGDARQIVMPDGKLKHFPMKVSVIGVVGCGSSCLLSAIDSESPQSCVIYQPTIGLDFINKPIKDPRDPTAILGNVQVWDKPSGKERLRTITRSCCFGSAIHLLCYDTSRDANFEVFIRDLLNTRSNLDAPSILVGTKSDLPPNPLTTDLANILSYILKIPHVRTSAKTMEGVSELMELIAEQGVRVAEAEKKITGHQKPPPPTKKRCVIQ
eukprot:TRINITY_DN460_c0_g1_i5.p1 TRINITY_DN460_c0_g1~~TRINITY_DN460_c0_g1_i5.p1  ORF type:complete len:288 (+),score=64.60 TRINITY_DN460_c0_g1_i5:38-865(+)